MGECTLSDILLNAESAYSKYLRMFIVKALQEKRTGFMLLTTILIQRSHSDFSAFASAAQK